VQAKIATPAQRLFLRNGIESTHTLAELEVTALRLRRGAVQPASGRVMTAPPMFYAPICRGQNVRFRAPSSNRGTSSLTASSIIAAPNTRGIHYDSGERTRRLEALRPRSGHAALRTLSPLGAGTLARGLLGTDESLRCNGPCCSAGRPPHHEVSAPSLRSGTMHIFAVSACTSRSICGMLAADLPARSAACSSSLSSGSTPPRRAGRPQPSAPL